MFRLPQQPARSDVLTFISKSASYGNLGAFIGAGFSKAVLNNDSEKIALSWGELLAQASKNMKVDYTVISKVGVGYPDIAAAICKTHSQETQCEYQKSLSKLKREIAALTSWYPEKDKREKFSKYLECLSLTTNYDLVIESLLTGHSIPLGPNDSLSSPKGITPVFHLHGLRTNPEEIIIAYSLVTVRQNDEIVDSMVRSPAFVGCPLASGLDSRPTPSTNAGKRSHEAVHIIPKVVGSKLERISSCQCTYGVR